MSYDVVRSVNTFKSLHGLAVAPTNLSQGCHLISSDMFHRRLHSVVVETCIVPRLKLGLEITVSTTSVSIKVHDFITVYPLPCVLLTLN